MITFFNSHKHSVAKLLHILMYTYIENIWSHNFFLEYGRKMSKKLIFRNKCFLRYILIIFRQLLYVRTTSCDFFFFNSEFNEKQQVNQLSEHVAVKNFFILFLCKLEFLQLYFETTDNIYPLYVSKF